MTGALLSLERWQVDQLLEYADGKPVKTPRGFGAPANLIRRGFIESAGYGSGAYRITSLGRHVLELHMERVSAYGVLECAACGGRIDDGPFRFCIACRKTDITLFV